MTIEGPTTCGDQMKEALSWEGPAIIECVVDPHEPPLPAKVQSEQVKKLFSALKAGTPNRKQIALAMMRDMLDESPSTPVRVDSFPGRWGGRQGRWWRR
jgi:pyruvate dehydrogenase (quinone)/pyruvate oxidase